MACCFPKLPKIRIVPESSHPHFCANLENPGRRLRYSGSPGSAAGDICITCGIRRHRHRSDCLARSAEACQPGASLQFPALAGLRNLGPDRGSKLGHNGAPPQPSRSFQGGHDRVAAKPDPDVPRPPVFDFSCDFDCPGPWMDRFVQPLNNSTGSSISRSKLEP